MLVVEAGKRHQPEGVRQAFAELLATAASGADVARSGAKIDANAVGKERRKKGGERSWLLGRVDKMERRVACDHQYIREWSLWMDVKILFRTLGVVFTQRNAY